MIERNEGKVVAVLDSHRQPAREIRRGMLRNKVSGLWVYCICILPIQRREPMQFSTKRARLHFLLIRASFAARRKFAQGVTFLADWPQRLSTLSHVSRTPDTIGSTGAAGSVYRDRWLDRERLWMSVQASLIFSLIKRNQKLVARVTKTVNTGLHPVSGWRRYSRILIVLVEKWHVVNDPKFYWDTETFCSRSEYILKFKFFSKRWIYLKIRIFSID